MRDPSVTIGSVSTRSVACDRLSTAAPARPWARRSGPGRLDLARRQVDLRPRIAQVALADAVGQVDDAMDPRVVLDGELAELRIDLSWSPNRS